MLCDVSGDARARGWTMGCCTTSRIRRFNVPVTVIEHGSFTLDNYVKYYCTRNPRRLIIVLSSIHNMNPTQPCVVFLELPSYAPKLFEDEIGDEDPVSKWLRGGIDGCVGDAR